MDLKGSQTEINLQTAFAGESQAHTKYEYYASQAKKDGYQQIAALFLETSHNEKEHAKIWFKYLHGGEMRDASQSRGRCRRRKLRVDRHVRRLAKTAREEGFEEIALRFEMVGAIEKQHEERYRALIDNIETGKVFSRDGDAIWICRNCGHIVIGKNAPEICPVCSHPKAFFELEAHNY